TFDIADFAQSLMESTQPGRITVGRCAVEKTDHRPRRLLRARRERPRRHRAAEKRDELAPPHGSVMPVWSFMDDLPADHSHCSRNVAEPSVINGERIGGQDSEVRQLAGLK